MPLRLSERGERLMNGLPHYYRDDPATWAVVDAAARELDRVEGLLEAVRAGAFPQTAGGAGGLYPRDDLYPSDALLPAGGDGIGSLLSIWEFIVGLPVAPPDVSEADRRRKVRAKLRRNVRKSKDWAQAITEALGTPEWAFDEQAWAGRIVLRLPAGSPGYTLGVMYNIARELTPAAYELSLGFYEGFLIGISEIGDAL